MVNRQDSERCVEAAIWERQPFGDGPNDRRGTGWALFEHLQRRLYSNDPTIGGLVGAGARADVDDRRGVTERPVDLALDARVGTAPLGVADPDPLVIGHTGSTPCLRQGRTMVLPLETCRPFQIAERVSAGSMMSSTWAWPAAM